MTLVSSSKLAFQPDIAVLEDGDAIYAVAGSHITVAQGREVATARSPNGGAWQAAAAIFSNGQRWVVAVAGGRLYRVTNDGRVEAIADQLGVEATGVVAVASAGKAFAVATQDEVLVSTDGTQLKRFSGGARDVVVAGARVAVARAREVEVWDLARGTSTRHPVSALQLGFLDASGAPRLVVRTRDGVFLEQGSALGALEVGRIEQFAVAGPRLWLRASGELQVLEAARVRSVAMAVSDRGRIFGSAAGDLWIADGGLLRRYRAQTSTEQWSRVIEPVVRRACLPCHAPGGEADIELATAEQWERMRTKIYRRAVMERTMPPETPLSDSDLATLRAWFEH